MAAFLFLFLAFLFFGAAAALLALIWAIDVYRHRHPLNNEEILSLSRKRQRNRALSVFDFSTIEQPADAAEKKAMRGQGEFVGCDLPYRDAPARIAGLLKYKKHEWIVIAFINSLHVRHLWWNKGPDGRMVWSFLADRALMAAIESLKPDSIAILHNHPNPDPSYYQMNIPSEADLRSAGFRDGAFSDRSISLLEFICERGVPHLYYASFAESVVPIDLITHEVQGANGTGILDNYRLRKELKRRTRAEEVAGGNAAPPPLPAPVASPPVLPPPPPPPKPAEQLTIPCPLCGKLLRVSTLKQGENWCPHCFEKFVAE
ncbi:MAG: hypothetical protein ACLQU3_15750 [Limisphaerales bacterium]